MAKFIWLLLICAVGCARGAGPMAASLSEPPAAEAPNAGSAPADPAAASADPAAAFQLSETRAVIRNASTQLTDEDPVAATERASALARDAGGFALDGSVQTASGQVTSSMIVLRVPEPVFEQTLAAIHKLGKLRQESITGQDVTEEFVDTEARLRALRTLEARLLALLEHSAKLTDLLQVEQEVARVDGEIERYEGRLRYLRERTRMATIQLTVQAPDQPYVPQSESVASRLSNAFRSSGELSLGVIESGIVALGFIVPAAAVLGLFAGPVLWFRRRRHDKLRASAAVV